MPRRDERDESESSASAPGRRRQRDRRDKRNRKGGAVGQGMRLFVAAYPPADLADDLARRVAAMIDRLGLPGSRPTPVEQIHLTVQFIGPTPKRRLAEALDSVRRATRGIRPFELEPAGLIRLPENGPAKLIALETDAPSSLLELHDRLARRFARRPRKRPSDRFLPHLTICRFTPPVAEIDSAALAEALRDTPAFRVDRIDLMQSTLRPDGAEHRLVQSIALDLDGES